MTPRQFHARIPDRELDVVVLEAFEVEGRRRHRLDHHIHLQSIQYRLLTTSNISHQSFVPVFFLLSQGRATHRPPCVWQAKHQDVDLGFANPLADLLAHRPSSSRVVELCFSI